MTVPGLVLDDNERDRASQAETARGTPLGTARTALRTCLETVTEQALAWHEEPDGVEAPHAAIRITTGSGKSEQIRQAIARFVPEAKQRGLPHRVLYLVPTHALGEEARLRMPAGVSTALWQGRTATQPQTGEPLCQNPEAVEAALKLGADVEETACHKGRGENEIKCPFYETCAYQAQKPEARDADVVFAAHEIVFQPPKTLDKMLGKGFGLVAIDESFWQDGLTDARIAIAGLAHEVQAFPVRDHGKVLEDDTAHLKDLIARVQRAFDAMPDGYVQRTPLIAEGLLPNSQYEPGSCVTARKLEWKRKVDAELRPDASAEQRQNALKQFAFMGQLPRRAAMWHALDELISGEAQATGRLRLETSTTKEGSVRYLRVNGRKDINKTLAGLPLIHADATLRIGIVHHYLPRLKLALDLDVEAPHERITQLVGLPVGKSSLQALAPGKRREGEEDRVSRKRQRLVDAVRHLVRGRRGLVVTYKDIEADFHQIEGIEVAHFNAIEGIDRWRDVDVVVIIGRPLPRPQDIERMAAALTGKPVVAGDMAERGRAIRLKSGAEHVLKGRVYETPEAELVRQAVTETAVVQAVGRARGVNRTEGNPVEAFLILHDTTTPLSVDAVAEFTSIEPNAVDEMIGRGLVPQYGADAAKLYPDLFPTAAAARQAFRRAHLNVERGMISVTSPYREISRISVTLPYRDLSIRTCHTVRVRYLPQGRGQQARLALVDPAKVPDPRAALGAVLGPLAMFETLPEADAQPAPVSKARPQRQPYQPDLLGAPVVDLELHRLSLEQRGPASSSSSPRPVAGRDSPPRSERITRSNFNDR
jgi:hypothetical protein